MQTDLLLSARRKLTYNLLLVLVQLHFGVGLHEHLDQNHAVLVPAADALHEARISDALFVLDVLQLRNVYARRAGRRRGEREPLAHGFLVKRPKTK